MQEKQCFRCKQVKPLTEFHKSSDGKYGHHAHCKVCRARHLRKRRQDPLVKAQYQKTNRERNQRNYWANPAQARANWSKFHQTLKGQAKAKLNYEIIRGRFPRVTTLLCAQCGAPAQEYHHHNGYTEEHWLDVVPLCYSCHGFVHRTID